MASFKQKFTLEENGLFGEECIRNAREREKISNLGEIDFGARTPVNESPLSEPTLSYK